MNGVMQRESGAEGTQEGDPGGGATGAPGLAGGAWSRRRALGLGAAAAVIGGLGTLLAGCSSGAAPGGTAAAPPGTSPPPATGAAPAVTPVAKPSVPKVAGYSGPTVPSTFATTLGISAGGLLGSFPTVGPTSWVKGGTIDLTALFASASIGTLQPALALAAWASKYPKVRFKGYAPLWSGAEGGKAPLLTELAGGTAPDIFPDYGDNPAPYVQQNALADLTPYVDAWPEWPGVPESLKGISTVAGKVYALPLNAPSGYVVCYRTDLFKAAGVAPPTSSWTTDDYLSLAGKLSNPAKKQWGTNLLWQYTNWYFSELAQPLGVPTAGYFFLIPNKTGTRFDVAPVPEIARALGYYQSFVQHKAALYGSSETYGTVIANDFVAGRAAMVIRQTKSLNYFFNNLGQPGFLQPSQVGIVPMPQGPEGLRNYDIGSNFYSVNAQSTGDKLTLAWEFLKDMLGPRGTELAYAVSGLAGTMPSLPPAYPGTALPSAISSLFPSSWLDLLTSKDVLGVPLPPSPSTYGLPPTPPGTSSGWDPFIQEAMVSPTKSPTSIAQALKAHMDAAVNNHPIVGMTKGQWHSYYKALGAYFQKYYPKYHSGTYTKYYKQFETF